MINSKRISDIQNKIKKAIATIEKEENVKISFGSNRYSSISYRTVMTVKTNDDEIVNKNNEYLSKLVGFTQNVVGMTFESSNFKQFENGEIFEIVEINKRSKKYPIIAKSSSGSSYKYGVETIKRLIGGDKIINRNSNIDKLLND